MRGDDCSAERALRCSDGPGGQGRGEGGASRFEYSDAATLPMMATPSVPPKSRVASFIAEPTPDLALGIAPMIASVAGALVRPIPVPRKSI